MIVVSDTGPIHYLLLIKRISLLSQLFDMVALPHAVVEELTDEGAPELVREWSNSLPAWVKIVDPQDEPETSDGRGKGERPPLR